MSLGTRSATAIAIAGDRNPEFAPHLATEAAFLHLEDPPSFAWIPTESIDPAAPEERLARFDGVLISPGSPYRSTEGALAAIRWAREKDELGEPRVLELQAHPFFFGTLYVPQLRSRPGAPHPLIGALVAAARARA